MSSEESWLVTGLNGCIGAWVGLTLAKDGKRVVGLDRSDRDFRLRLISTPEQLAQIGTVHGDVADLAFLERTLEEHAVTHIVHLAALQVPFCRADPTGGAHVNVVGSAAVFEAARRAWAVDIGQLRELGGRLRRRRADQSDVALRLLQDRHRGHRPDLLAGPSGGEPGPAAVGRLRAWA